MQPLRYKPCALALALLLVFAPVSQAASAKTLPGSNCNDASSSQQLTYGDIVIGNRTASQRSAVCPIPRENVALPWIAVTVQVRDRSDAGDICCRLRASNALGQAGGYSAEQCTTGQGEQTLAFGQPPAGQVPVWGPLALVCSLPAMENNVPSYVASYQIVEP